MALNIGRAVNIRLQRRLRIASRNATVSAHNAADRARQSMESRLTRVEVISLITMAIAIVTLALVLSR